MSGNRFSVIVVGAGKIAQGYDTPDGPSVLSHVKGFKKHGAFTVTGICDVDPSAARVAGKRWGIPSVAQNPEDLSQRADIISVCTPDSTHVQYLRRCLALQPRLVFCEKPIGLSLAECNDVVDAYERAGVLLAVNYSRRWLPETQDIKNRIARGELGSIQSVRIKYYSGFLHNASHLLDLISLFLNPVVVRGNILTEDIFEAEKADSTISGAFLLHSERGEPFTLMLEGYDGRKLAPTEIEFVFEKERVLFEESDGAAISVSALQENSAYPGFFEFSRSIQRFLIDVSSPIQSAISNLANVLEHQAELLSSGASALQTLKLCLSIKANPRSDS